MPEATTWGGFASDVLQDVLAVLTEAQGTIGAESVRIGEEKRGWAYPAIQVYLGAGGVRRSKASGRTDTDLYEIPVTILAVLKDPTRSLDLEALELMERTMDVLDAEQPLGGSMRHDWRDPVRVAPIAAQEGQYETGAVAEVVFLKKLSRPHRSP